MPDRSNEEILRGDAGDGDLRQVRSESLIQGFVDQTLNLFSFRNTRSHDPIGMPYVQEGRRGFLKAAGYPMRTQAEQVRPGRNSLDGKGAVR